MYQKLIPQFIVGGGLFGSVMVIIGLQFHTVEKWPHQMGSVGAFSWLLITGGGPNLLWVTVGSGPSWSKPESILLHVLCFKLPPWIPLMVDCNLQR